MNTLSANVHMDVLIPGGFRATISIKISQAQELADFGHSLSSCGINPYIPQFGRQQQPVKDDTPAEPDHKDLEEDTAHTKIQRSSQTANPPEWKNSGTTVLMRVASGDDPNELIQPAENTSAPVNGNKPELKPMPDFIPQNVQEIIDIEVRTIESRERDKMAIFGKAEDGIEFELDKQLKEQLHSIGYDVSTWDVPEPYISETITIATNTYNVIQQIKNPDGVWTWSRVGRNLKQGDIICLRDFDLDDGISYHEIEKNNRFLITFTDGHPAIENSGMCYVCLTHPPALKLDIPF